MKKKKKRLNIKAIISFIVVLGLIIVGGYFIFFKKEVYSFLDVVLKDDLTVELNSEVYNNDFVNYVKNGDLIEEKERVDTSSLGEKEVVVKLRNSKDNISEYKFKVSVVDREKPVIEYKKELVTSIGKKIDLLNSVSCKDNSGEDIKVEVVGDYDFEKSGEYILYYVAKDSSLNEAKEEFKLVVKDNNKQNIDSNTNDNINNNSNNESNEFTTSKGYKGVVKNGITYINGLMVVNKSYSVPSSYAPGLNSEVESKGYEMLNAAKGEGLSIRIQSGFRSYDTQKRLYNNYVNGYGKEAADTFSARPGYSEHQSGLAFDVCSNDSSKGCINSSFDNTDEAKWLANNCYKYGFILRYPKGKENETGYMYESWHFRYVGDIDLAKKLYNNGDWLSLEDYLGIDSKYE